MLKKDGSLTVSGDIFFLLISILLNSFGNALTVSLNLGSALWTASSVNLSHLLNFSLTGILFWEGVAVVLSNALLLRRFDLQRILGNFVFMLPFSYLVGMLADLLSTTGLNQLPLVVKILLDLTGILFIAAGVSIYQRVNLILHPNDDFMQIIRFKFLHGNAAKAQTGSFLVPVCLIIICVILNRDIWAINIGTVFSFLFQGYFVGVADKTVFPKLHHQRLSLGK
ncbi:membrane protein [Ligilactobacillus salitolerans]|uniref:Membrane protein n=1 Tax=Ligilactobacillus salitolerans TaxID=1808352 RepID=A0A401IQL8_9LACO|nr:hypothetical protein [Ligilactobacillus salitolerans]GBG93794.1 membrane protein [Ligilactobacillus salitolerans]